jgi:hypothetical protein
MLYVLSLSFTLFCFTLSAKDPPIISQFGVVMLLHCVAFVSVVIVGFHFDLVSPIRLFQ